MNKCGASSEGPGGDSGDPALKEIEDERSVGGSLSASKPPSYNGESPDQTENEPASSSA